eukprot:TRINITY_DN65816_c5_g1_i2.p1 TRINITY_DN65816_c5_g1~~TRINITY_DN65816_c5_g1_i2.p1  ORF type:complete len:337 (-),score=127.12 TRINITY_DN65816_c5_g1_i2:183-1193(-)
MGSGTSTAVSVNDELTAVRHNVLRASQSTPSFGGRRAESESKTGGESPQQHRQQQLRGGGGGKLKRSASLMQRLGLSAVSFRNWSFIDERGYHHVYLEHNVLTGRRLITVDEVELVRVERQLVDFGSDHRFGIGTTECLVRIIDSGAVFRYELHIDGVPIAQWREQFWKRATRWTFAAASVSQQAMLSKYSDNSRYDTDSSDAEDDIFEMEDEPDGASGSRLSPAMARHTAMRKQRQKHREAALAAAAAKRELNKLNENDSSDEPIRGNEADLVPRQHCVYVLHHPRFCILLNRKVVEPESGFVANGSEHVFKLPRASKTDTNDNDDDDESVWRGA